MDIFYTVKEAADKLGVSIWTIYRMLERRKLDAEKYKNKWRIRLDQLVNKSRS